MLRSSSTPILGSLVASLIPGDHHQQHQPEVHGPTHKHSPSPINGNGNGSHQELRRPHFDSPEIKGFGRVESDGHLEGLAGADEFSFSNKLGRRRRNSISCCTMRPIPAPSFQDKGEELHMHMHMHMHMRVVEQVSDDDDDAAACEGDEGKMYLATGLGGGGGSYRPVAFDRGGGMEEHYEKMLEHNPGNSLLLTNYAHFLYKVKGDSGAAEEYYSRAILADEGEDGEILSQYAKLIWELHRDKDRAADYFQRAVQVSSDNSHIHAAYASFLWDTEDEVEEGEQNAAQGNSQVAQPLFHHGFMSSATA